MKLWGAEQDEVYEGPLLVTLQLEGGVDVTQLCDPKVNVRGEPKINHWADAADPGQAGNILFAPIADNAQLFQEFGSDMLVINGVDAQTNSHETGKLFNWTGSNAEGRPSLSALFAASQSPKQPLAYSVFGGFSRTGGLIGYNQFSNLSAARTLVQPYSEPWGGNPRRSPADIARASISKVAPPAILPALLGKHTECIQEVCIYYFINAFALFAGKAFFAPVLFGAS